MQGRTLSMLMLNPARDIEGLFSSLILGGASGGAGAVSAAAAGLVWAVAWRFSRAVRSDASVRSSVSYVQFRTEH